MTPPSDFEAALLAQLNLVNETPYSAAKWARDYTLAESEKIDGYKIIEGMIYGDILTGIDGGLRREIRALARAYAHNTQQLESERERCQALLKLLDTAIDSLGLQMSAEFRSAEEKFGFLTRTLKAQGDSIEHHSKLYDKECARSEALVKALGRALNWISTVKDGDKIIVEPMRLDVEAAIAAYKGEK